MIKITNGRDIIEVTNSAYDNMYKGLGFAPFEEKAKGKKAAKDEEPTADEAFIKEFEEKPATRWGKNDLKKYAELRGIDLSGTKSFNEAKAVVKEFVDNVLPEADVEIV